MTLALSLQRRGNKRRWLVGLYLSLLWTGQALALSCMPPTVENVFSKHLNSAGQYAMAVGTISLIDPLPKFDPATLEHEPPGRFRAMFEGHMARETGFDLRARLPIWIERTCFDEVCGFLPLRRPAALFLLKDIDGYVLHTEYCNSTLLPDPSEADLERLISCLNGDDCADGG